MPNQELPAPDVIDSAGRMRRLVVALLVGGVVAAIAFAICNSLAKPDAMPSTLFDGGSKRRAYGFVYYTTALAGGIAFSIALAVQNHLAKKQWRRQRLPRAEVR